MKRLIPLLITAFGGFVLVVSYFIPDTQTWGETVSTWFTILAAIAFILGGGSLLKMNLKRISDQSPGWGYAAVTVVSFLATLIIGLSKIGVNPAEKYPDAPWSGSYREPGSPFWWLYEFAFRPLTATMFAMLAFYVASAAFRAFRAKNLEASLLLGTAFIILLGRSFAGVWLTEWIPEDGMFGWLRFENLTVHIMNIFNTAANRAIMIGIALGLASTSLKVLLGVDRSYLGKE